MQNYHSSAPLSILIVDDTAVNRLVIGSILKELGCQVTEAVNGKAAVELILANNAYDMVLMDINMPIMNGLEAIHCIRTQEAVQVHTKVIALTAHERESTNLANAGFDDILTKPIILERVAVLLTKHFPHFQHSSPNTDYPNTPLPSSEQPVNLESDNPMILLVEDNQVNCIVATNMLNTLGYEADITNNGCEAVTACAEKQYTLILMDIRMPMMDGTEATQLIRQYSNYVNTPIVAVTANTSPADIMLYKQSGMDDVLAKPLTLERLKMVLDKYLQMTPEQVNTAKKAYLAGFAVLDHLFLKKVTLNNPKLLVMLLERFIIETTKQLIAMEHAAKNLDQHKLLHLSHSLKGGARSIGANRLGEIAAQMEMDMEATKLQTISQYLQDLQQEFLNLQTLMQQTPWNEE
ncbi:response regulator [Beggiatoa leptomitoformis]|uniref:Response regulator n=1 Tax=Beggiatoa leptomitoformis TaxID=288004 RepID=A0A2N9YHW9_9GAMM|nr:response regulator [Beggiatoa leptomitoformis]ALG67627.1 response regulator [Beggiatoa leptomitoformis]AUI70141.1 response regulator [Beggiatoa leptomitoformis]